MPAHARKAWALAAKVRALVRKAPTLARKAWAHARKVPALVRKPLAIARKVPALARKVPGLVRAAGWNPRRRALRRAVARGPARRAAKTRSPDCPGPQQKAPAWLSVERVRMLRTPRCYWIVRPRSSRRRHCREDPNSIVPDPPPLAAPPSAPCRRWHWRRSRVHGVRPAHLFQVARGERRLSSAAAPWKRPRRKVRRPTGRSAAPASLPPRHAKPATDITPSPRNDRHDVSSMRHRRFRPTRPKS